MVNKVFTIKKNTNIILQIIPDNKISNGLKINNLVNSLHTTLYSSLMDRVDIRNREYSGSNCFSYEIYMEQGKFNFSLVVPEQYKENVIGKIKTVWQHAKVDQLLDDYVKNISISTSQYAEIDQKERYFKSLAINHNSNAPIPAILGISRELGEKDKILIQVTLKPISDYWHDLAREDRDKFRKGIEIEKTSSLFMKAFEFGIKIIEGIFSLFDTLFGVKVEDKKPSNVRYFLTQSSTNKLTEHGFEGVFRIICDSQNPIQREQLIRSTCNAFTELDGDNKLKIKEPVISFQSSIRPMNKKYYGYVQERGTGKIYNNNIYSVSEVSQILQMPTKEWQEQYRIVNVDSHEIAMPEDLFNLNSIMLGELLYAGAYRNMGFGTHPDSLAKPLILFTEMGGGKTTFLINYALSAIELGHSIFAFDTTDGKTMKHIRDYLPKNFPKEKIIVLDFRDYKYIFPLAWNELMDIFDNQMKNIDDEYERYALVDRFGSSLSKELTRFIDTLQMDYKDQSLTPNMRSVLNTIAQLVFMNKGNFSMIKDCLSNEELRHRLLDNLKLPEGMPFVQDILKIDQVKEDNITIRGIETRLNLILENNELKKYFSTDAAKSLDFAKWANDGYCVLIRVPQENSNILVTFLVQKLWLAKTTSLYYVEESKRPHTHLLIDEPHRFKTVMDIINDQLVESRKWHLRFVFCVHNMDVFGRARKNLTSAGCSFIVPPTTEDNFNTVAEFFKPMDIEEMEKVKQLTSQAQGKRRYAYCSIDYNMTHYPCIIRMPLPAEERFKFIDRADVNEECGARYGITIKEYYQSILGLNDNIQSDNENIEKPKKEVASIAV